MTGLPRDETTVLLPSLNEAGAIETVIDGFQNQGYENVLVIDGGSTDGTQELAEKQGAEVLEQSGTGKGQAVQQALDYIDARFVLMADADETYDPVDADRMLKPLVNGNADRTVGNRFGKMDDDAMDISHKAANYGLNSVFWGVHGRNYGDILSGYHGFNQRAMEELDITEDGFGVEAQMAAQSVHRPIRTVVVPIHYHERADNTESKINPVRDFLNILRVIFAERLEHTG